MSRKKRSNGTQGHGFVSLHRSFNGAQLFARKLASFRQPPDQDVRIEQKPGRQSGVLFLFRTLFRGRRVDSERVLAQTVPKGGGVRVYDVTHDFTPPGPAVSWRFPRGLFGRSERKRRGVRAWQGRGEASSEAKTKNWLALLDEEVHSGLIIPSGSNVRFWHLTFREALAKRINYLTIRVH